MNAHGSKLTKILALAGIMFAVACAQPLGLLGVISTRDDIPNPTILAHGVVGRSCSWRRADYGAAVDDAIKKVAGANVMHNAKLFIEFHFYIVCTRAEGDVGVLR